MFDNKKENDACKVNGGLLNFKSPFNKNSENDQRGKNRQTIFKDIKTCYTKVTKKLSKNG